mgnify:CR=1 FL=1
MAVGTGVKGNRVEKGGAKERVCEKAKTKKRQELINKVQSKNTIKKRQGGTAKETGKGSIGKGASFRTLLFLVFSFCLFSSVSGKLCSFGCNFFRFLFFGYLQLSRIAVCTALTTHTAVAVAPVN